MRKIIKFLSFSLCICFLITAFTSCSGNDADDQAESTLDPSLESSQDASSEPTESETLQTEEESTEGDIETEYVDEVVCFVDYVRESARGYHDLKTRGDAAISFTVPEGYLTKLYLNLTDNYGYTECSIDLNIYRFTGYYKSTIETEPIYSEYITSSLRTYNVFFEEGEMPAGDYLVVLSYVEPPIETETIAAEADNSNQESGSTESSETEKDENENKEPEKVVHGKVIYDNFWYGATIPAEYEKYNMQSYANGRTNKRTVFCGGMEVALPVEQISNEEKETEGDDLNESPENEAKVILIGGQSNATGATRAPFLKNNVSEEKYQEYENGYSNVKILYSSGALSAGGINIPNKVYEFVDCKLGQGIASNAYGPELGLAAYLNETYPNETFYIIKYAIGSSGLRAHWNATDEEKDSCLEGFRDTLELGLDLLEDQGLDPRIVAFLWMQGESDASTAYSSYNYYNLQNALVEEIRNDFAFYSSDKGIAFIDAAVCTDGVWSMAFLVNYVKEKYSHDSDINFYIDINDYGITGLNENNDPAHFDSLSMILLGELYGKELSRFLE